MLVSQNYKPHQSLGGGNTGKILVERMASNSSTLCAKLWARNSVRVARHLHLLKKAFRMGVT